MVKNKNISFTIFLILLVLMPMHTLVFSKLLGSVKILSMWRDVCILFLAFFSLRNKININLLNVSLLLSISTILCFSVMTGGFSAFNTARTYCVPLLIYFYTRGKRFSEEELFKIYRTMMITATLIAFWGMLQAYVMGPEIMFKIGYSSIGGRFEATAFYINGWQQQRVFGTFSSPNACGAFFAIVIVLLVRVKDQIYNKYMFWICVGIITAGLIGTFSRSAWIGCILGLLFFNNNRKIVTIKAMKYIVGGLILLVLGVIILSRTSIFNTVVSMLINHLGNTVSKKDASFVYHLQQLYQPMAELRHRPFGLGFGTNGSIALSHLPVEQTHQFESSVWVMGYELGMLGMIIYFFPYIYALVHFAKKRQDVFASCAAKICLCTLMTFLVLPSVQNYEAPFYVMLFVGMASNSEKRSFLERRLVFISA